ncbi:hypothetical protein QTO34_005389 [Cnephaeus nilssonii]|uniref:Beta-1,4-galactosyltransferase n=1 Tax=Cnephaeus nilssonii TaxID=3371016 RepID=A0AA40HP43_CNENI|nr:hypothetical protein QTO34_005389 [Eptesicus nilssonii]
MCRTLPEASWLVLDPRSGAATDCQVLSTPRKPQDPLSGTPGGAKLRPACRCLLQEAGQTKCGFLFSGLVSESMIGPMLIEFNVPVDLTLLAKQNPEVKVGGRYAPKDCISPHKVAIIIPFRNRQEHLKYWLYYLHPILQRQQLDYGIYVINQAGESTFNRAKLLNVGFQEALKDYDYNCFVFSDVDLIPMDDRNAYRCFSQPRHISVAMDKFGFSLPYVQFFGGVSALSKQQFLTINGFPNNYWGWGGEDDDIFNRLVFKGMSISRPNAVVGKCRMIRHSRDKKNEPNPQRFDRIAHTKETMLSDGLNTLTYKVLDIERNPLYTKITVDVGTPS